ncbi:MAG: endonuclease MutS2 [Acidobacteria bacterium]|nr:endonuclease MutS2 [Acidobacteriota bacterium]
MNDTNPFSNPVDSFSCRVLEFGEIQELLREFLSGPISEGQIAALAPQADFEAIKLALDRVREAIEYLRENQRPSLGGLEDPHSILEKLHIEGITCTAREILGVLAVTRRAQELRKCFDKSISPNLAALTEGLEDFRPLLAAIDGKIHPDGHLDSSASPALGRIRRAIERLRGEVQSTLENLMRQFSRDKVLQDAVVMVRNDRLVIPVRAEEKRRVPGVIHGASSSGVTVFLEPLETVPMNNELVELEDREYSETQRILGEFTEKLREQRRELLGAVEIMGELDVVFAKAEFSRAYDCCLPEFTDRRELLLAEVRHPLLEKTLAKSGDKPVPLNVELREPKSLMIISGPNAGGKTVALKTIGISVLMAQAGLPVAAAEARLPIFRRALADIGDQQSIQANLSTFSAHITNIRAMVEIVGSDDLVLLDELGSSTEPGEGAALAIAILEWLRKSGAMTFVSTHHGRLKAYASETREAENAAMEFDEETLQPTYRLLIGLPGNSSALEIAARLGLPGEILTKARELIGSEEAAASSLLRLLHEQKAAYELRLAKLRSDEEELKARAVEMERQSERERRAKLQELDSRLENELRNMQKRWDDSLADLRAQILAPKLKKTVERKVAALKQETRGDWNAQVLDVLAESSSSEQPTEEAPIAVGDHVKVPNFAMPGTVTAILDNGQIEVEVGRLRLRVEKDKASVVARRSEPAPQSAPTGAWPVVRVEGTPGEVANEINVIGNSAEEAAARVDEFLDRAYISGRFRLRVIHGHGKGILRRSLHEMFASHPHVEKFYPAPRNEGGTGATIVELKT